MVKFLMGKSTVQWTILDPCLGLSESDAKLYTNFEVYEKEIHKHQKTCESTKPSNSCSQKNNFE